jgi:nucleotide-binding universal stress UspA family protein
MPEDSAVADSGAGLILVGVDGSEGSIAALRWAIREGRSTGARVEAVYVYANPPELSWYVSGHGRLPPAVPPDRATVLASAQDELARAVRRAVGDASSTSLTTRVVEHVSASTALAHLGQPADLLVVGAHLATGLGRLFGSTTAGVLRHASCPVVVVPGPPTAPSAAVGAGQH